MWKLLFFFLLSTSLSAIENADESRPTFTPDDESFPLADIDGEPSSIVAGCVNVITGDFVDMRQDFVMSGSTPIKIERSYSSSDTS